MADDSARIDPSHRDQPQVDMDGIVALRAKRHAAVDLERVSSALSEDVSLWLGTPAGMTESGLTSYLCDLELAVGPDSRSVFRKAAIVSLGTPRRATDRWIVPIEWRAATAAPLFPVFVGRLTVTANALELNGRYAPPFGLVGYVLDRTVLGIAARRTAAWFLARIEAVIAGDE